MMELVGSAASSCNKHGKTFKWLGGRAQRDRLASSLAQLEAIFIKALFNKSFRLALMAVDNHSPAHRLPRFHKDPP